MSSTQGDKTPQHRHGILAWMRMPCSPFGTLTGACLPMLGVLIALTIGVLLLIIQAFRGR